LNTRKRPLNSKVKKQGLVLSKRLSPVIGFFFHHFLNEQDGSGLPVSLLNANKSKNQSGNGNEIENEESISDADLENIVGGGDSSELEVLMCMRILCVWSF
jgi:DNA repair protein RAD5